ncbi:signal-regulatory protein beta-2-like isoform X3 [Sander lucioperca]|uniref:signal-regulatory protein beta-2-like isoform X3 n=1 Tax=Sander lucioperca TaxID=283035 RepID=UPI0016538F2B|nr:signal-regulatory protein beta-2-like isoform X3 [Sander lucioperca]
MMIVVYLLLMLRVGRCTDDQIFENRTVGVGGDVRLTCTRESTGSLFWIRLVSGEFPKVLGKTFSFESDPRITATEEPRTFVLHIAKARLSDTAVYYCMKIHRQNFTFLKGADLRVEGPEPDPTAVPPSDPVGPGDSVTLQCSVLSDSENKTCPEEQSVFCFRAGSHQCGPGFNYTQGNSVEEHEKNPEGLSTKKCIYSLFKNVSSSDGGTYYCAVVTCGEIFSGNGSKLETEAAVALQTNAATASGHQQSQQTDEDLVYSAPIFTSRKASKGGTRDAKTEEEESIYSDVRAQGLD